MGRMAADDDDEFTIMKALNIKEFNDLIADDNADRKSVV